MECPGTPSREVLVRSRLHFQENLTSSILQQERLHAASKKPRRTRFVVEADSKIQSIAGSVLEIRRKVMAIHSEFKSLENKINRLDVIKEQACFFMSPKRVLSSAGIMSRRSPMKLTYYSPSPAECSSDQGYSSPTKDKLVEFLRRRKLVAIHLSKVIIKLNAEKKLLDDIFQDNMQILRFKRAEKSLIKIIGLQSKLKILGKEFEGLEERLFPEDRFDADSFYNILSH